MIAAEEQKPLRKDWTSLVVLLLVCAVVIQQTRFLFVYPVPDTGMWFGDESWTTLTARALVETGVARIPEAVGSSLAHSNGLVNGSIWISGILYGLPAHLFASFAMPVNIGRMVTLALCIVGLILVYRTVVELTSSTFAAAVALLALVTSDAFAFSSHCARFDAATSVAVFAYLLHLLYIFQRRDNLTRSNVFAVTFFAVISLAVYVHVPTLIAFPALFTFWRVRIWKRAHLIMPSIAGALVGVIIIVSLYWISTGSLDLLGKGYNQYYNVANSLPIMHPFSWRVQYINTVLRAMQVWDVAWPLVLLLAIGGISAFISQRKLSESCRFWLWLMLLTIIGWCAFEGPAVFYNIHVLPVFAVSAALLLSEAFNSMNWRIPAMTAAIAVASITLSKQERRGIVGATISRGNTLASFITPASGARIMADEPALNELAYLERTPANIKLATKHFLLFGGEQKSPSEILREHDVKYLVLYSTVRYQSQLRPIADSFYTVIAQREGILTDQARSYDNLDSRQVDTMRLYKMK